MIVSKIMCPETAKPETTGQVKVPKIDLDTNAIEAIARGASEGMKLEEDVSIFKRALSPNGNPSLETIARIVRSLAT